MTEVIIGDNVVGGRSAPFIIAEMSGNHNHSLPRALELVEAAASAGAHAIKLQTYTAETMTLNVRSDAFLIQENDSLWKNHYLYELYDKAHTPWEWHGEIMQRAKKCGLLCFSSPFDETAVDFLETLDVPAYKIASFENTDLPLIRRVAETGKPVIISTGMASIAEIDDAVSTVKSVGNNQCILLKCTSAYPASPAESNLLTIPDMREKFECEVGLSDHTIGIGAALVAIAHGASVVEKHLTVSRDDDSVDSAFSIEPGELKQLVSESVSAKRALGHVFYGPTASEQSAVTYRRSLYVAEDIKAGDVITASNVRRVRPGGGLPPRYQADILGRRVTCDVCKGTPFSWDLLD